MTHPNQFDGKTTVDRFNEKFRKNKNGCWEWEGSINSSGYGHMKYKNKTEGAHRVAWKLFKGEIPSGEGHHGTCVLHECDNRKCVNPDHLFLGSNLDNVKDREKKGRGGFKGGEVCHLHKLKEEDVINIREIKAYVNITYKALANIFKVSPENIRQIVLRSTWKHI